MAKDSNRAGARYNSDLLPEWQAGLFSTQNCCARATPGRQTCTNFMQRDAVVQGAQAAIRPMDSSFRIT